MLEMEQKVKNLQKDMEEIKEFMSRHDVENRLNRILCLLEQRRIKEEVTKPHEEELLASADSHHIVSSLKNHEPFVEPNQQEEKSERIEIPLLESDPVVVMEVCEKVADEEDWLDSFGCTGNLLQHEEDSCEQIESRKNPKKKRWKEHRMFDEAEATKLQEEEALTSGKISRSIKAAPVKFGHGERTEKGFDSDLSLPLGIDHDGEPGATKSSLIQPEQRNKSMVRRLEKPLFSGEIANNWIFEVEQYFERGKFAEEEKLQERLGFDVEALILYREERNRNLVLSGEQVIKQGVEKFMKTHDATPGEKSLPPDQEEAVKSYGRGYIALATIGPEITKKVWEKAFMIGPRVKIRVEAERIEPRNLKNSISVAKVVEFRSEQEELPAKEEIGRSLRCEDGRPRYGRFTPAEITKKKALGLGFRCDEKVHARHRYLRKELWLFAVQEDGSNKEWGKISDSVQEISAMAELSFNLLVETSSQRIILPMETRECIQLYKNGKLQLRGISDPSVLPLEMGNVDAILYTLWLITLEEMKDISLPWTLQWKGTIQVTEIVIQRDNKAFHQFLYKEVVRRLGDWGLIAREMSGFGLLVVIELIVNAYETCRDVELLIQVTTGLTVKGVGVEFVLLRFPNVTGLLLLRQNKDDMILGTQWLETLGEMKVNTKLQTLKWQGDNKMVTLNGVSSLCCTSIPLTLLWEATVPTFDLEDKVKFKGADNGKYEAMKGIIEWQKLLLGTGKQSHVMKASRESHGHNFVMSLLVSYVITWAALEGNNKRPDWDGDTDVERQPWECLVIVLKFSCSGEDTPTQTFYLLGLVFSRSEKNKQEQIAIVLDFVTVAGQVGERCPKIKAIPRKMETFTKLCSLVMLSSENEGSCCKQKLGDNATLEVYLDVCIAWVIVINVGPQVGNKLGMQVGASPLSAAMTASVEVYHNLKSTFPSGNDELFLVEKGIPIVGLLTFPIVSLLTFRVSRLDEKAGKWVEVTDLGDRVLFIGHLGNVSCSAKELPDGCGGSKASLIQCFVMAEPSMKKKTLIPDWSQLPGELLHIISENLHNCFDVVHARSVCSSWRSTFPFPCVLLRPNYSLPTFSIEKQGLWSFEKIPLFLFRVRAPVADSVFFLGEVSRVVDHMELLPSPLQCSVKVKLPECDSTLMIMLDCQIFSLGYQCKMICWNPQRLKTIYRCVAFLPLNKEEFAVICYYSTTLL
ncbi:hypothetical protein AALP_AA6G266900 [Arabis alpina]|uniref:KIB1-4 beta-propeller domain-containing protein n=1 Tax=Arabis alpina TaxID=50452 RepID=A0A087GRW2_ARAAL|nr:hypothetical protein AALP_AA6G266900 [Arabis alpina]